MIGMRRITLAVVLLLVALTSARAGERLNIVLDLGNGEELPLTVILPSLYEEDDEHPVIFALPPGAGDRNMVNAILANYWTDEGDRRGYILVSPAVLGRSLERRGHEVLDAVFTWMDENLSYDRTRVTLAGQSNGGLGAFFAARMQPDRFATIVVMPGGYGGQGDLDALKDKPVWLIVGERDTSFVQLAHRTRDFLVLAGAQPRLDVVPGRGHVFPYPSKDLYDWIESKTNPE